MPYSPEHTQATREKILKSARRLFNRRGFADVSIDEVMAGAGLTRGGFYAHFPNKETLFAEAVTHILVDHPAQHWEGVDFDLTGPDIVRVIINAYLSDQHMSDIEGSCPMIALPSDVARGGEKVRQAFRQVLNSMTGIFESQLAPSPTAREDALATAALCVGGMVLARAVDDPALATELRAAAHAQALRVIGQSQAYDG